jgi:hypothetical protein
MPDKKQSPISAVTSAAIGAAGLAYFLFARPWHLRWGATHEELSAPLPGDAICPNSAGQVTHAITIDAQPEMVWPWIMQIGQDRGGFYSYTILENMVGCEMPNVVHIFPEWQDRAVGDTVWFATPKHFDGQARMIAAIVEPQRALILATPADWERIRAGVPGEEPTWGFFLKPTGEGKTRLIARSRREAHPGLWKSTANYTFWEPAHFIMERKMLLKIKQLAERDAIPSCIASSGAAH